MKRFQKKSMWQLGNKHFVKGKVHYYQENECKYKFLSIKGGMSFLRHYYLLITKWHALLPKGG